MATKIDIHDETHKKIINLLNQGWVSRKEICEILGNVTPFTCINHINAISVENTVSERQGVFGVEYKILNKQDFEFYEKKRQLLRELGIKDNQEAARRRIKKMKNKPLK